MTMKPTANKASISKEVQKKVPVSTKWHRNTPLDFRMYNRNLQKPDPMFDVLLLVSFCDFFLGKVLNPDITARWDRHCLFCCFSYREGNNTWQTLPRWSKITLQTDPRRENWQRRTANIWILSKPVHDILLHHYKILYS
jgi:hypothetical protein